MQFYRQEMGMGGFPTTGQRFGPPQMSQQQIGLPRANEFSRPREFYYAPYPFDPRQGQQFNPYFQGPGSRNRGLSDNLNTMMGHMGTITNGINMMRQVGVIMSLFR